jgi:hypothetical protein
MAWPSACIASLLSCLGIKPDPCSGIFILVVEFHIPFNLNPKDTHFSRGTTARHLSSSFASTITMKIAVCLSLVASVAAFSQVRERELLAFAHLSSLLERS